MQRNWSWYSELVFASGYLWGITLPYDLSSLMDPRNVLIFILFICLWTPNFLCVGSEIISLIYFPLHLPFLSFCILPSDV